MKRMTLLALACSLHTAGASPLYTNTWINAQGQAVTNLYRDAANWQVRYEPSVTPPASAVPTKDSLTYLLKSATVALADGDDHKLGTTYFLGCSTTWKTLNLIIPTGAKLALDGTSLTSHMNTSDWVNGGTANHVLFDIDGGSLTLGQKIFSMRGNTSAAWNNVPVNRIVVRNGGTLSVTNGYVRLWGGSSDDSQGRGLYTNVIDVLEGSTLTLRNTGRLAFGSSHSTNHGGYDTPWTESTYGGGWVNVKGGQLLCKGSTTSFPIVFNGHANADMGSFLNVTDGGVVNLGGKAIYLGAHQTKVSNGICVSGGGVITNGDISVQHGSGGKEDHFVDVRDGTVFLNGFKFATSSGNGSGRMTIRVHGSDSIFTVNGTSLHTPYSSTPPFLNDMRLAPHTPRNADFPVHPIVTRIAYYGSGGDNVAYALGYWRLSPDGGFQLVHAKTFDLLARHHDGDGMPLYRFDARYGGFIGEEMWLTNAIHYCQDRWKRCPGVAYEHAFVYRVTLKDEAQLTDGVALAQPRPRAWLQLPKFTSREVCAANTERISVRLALVEPTAGGLDLDGIVRRMRENGYPQATVDESVAGYNVRVDLPIDELAADTTDDKIVLDFVTCETYGQASGLQPMVTNALIRAATCERKACPETARSWPRLRGTMLGSSSESDIRTLAQWRASLVRYQMAASWSSFASADDPLAAFQQWIDGRLDHLEEMLPWAREHGLRICVDLHTPIGGYTDETYNSHMIFVEQQYEDALVATWEKIARRFKGNWDVLYGYDLLNEPIDRENSQTHTTWRAVASRVIEAIRAIDIAAVIVYEPNCHGSPRGFDAVNIYGLSSFQPLPYDNVVYSTHIYLPMEFTHQGLYQKKEAYVPLAYPNATNGWDKAFLREQTQSVRDVQTQLGVRILVGEFSAAAYAPGADRYLNDLCELFEEFGWDWCYHAFREATCWNLEYEGDSYYELKPAKQTTPRLHTIRHFLRKGSPRPSVIQIQ